MFYTKTIKINNFISFNKKAIQCVPIFLYSSKFITYAPFLVIFGKLSLEYTPLNLDSLA